MKKWKLYSLISLAIVLLICGWITYFHNDALTTTLPKWGWLQWSVKHLGQGVTAAPVVDEDVDTAKNEIPVHVGPVTTETVHLYIEGIGVVAPAPPRLNKPAGSANIASPAPGVVLKVLCQIGQQVHAGDPLIQLDDRLARSAEDQAVAAAAQAEASLAALKAPPKPEAIAVAELAVQKSRSALEFSRRNFERVTALAAEQGASAKALEQARLDQASAENDLNVSQKQLDLLKSGPTPELLNQENAKVAQAKAALAAAQTQLKMATITAPIDGTVVQLLINPGEAVDSTRTLVTLIALDRLTVDLDVPSDQLPPNAEGLGAEVRMTSQKKSDDPILGKIAFISPQVDPKNGAVVVSIDLPADAKLLPGQSVSVRIIAGEHKDVLAVPRSAVIPDENGDNVICVVEGETATHKAVKVGYEENGLMEVSGFELKSGMSVVTNGAFGLKAMQATHIKILQ